MLSVILPSYNEEKMIAVATRRMAEVLGGAGIEYELLFVDDGSKDGTWSEIRRCAAENNVTLFTSLDTVRVLLDVLEETTITVSTIDA